MNEFKQKYQDRYDEMFKVDKDGNMITIGKGDDPEKKDDGTDPSAMSPQKKAVTELSFFIKSLDYSVIDAFGSL